MTDLLVFMAGGFVTLMVAGAVGLLIWGASEEEKLPEVRDNTASRRKEPSPAAVWTQTSDSLS